MSSSNPFADLSKMLEQFKLPGLDMNAMMQKGRDDVNALVEANKTAFEAMQAMARKQAEMFAQSMQGLQEAAQKAYGNATQGSAGMPNPGDQMALARAAYDKTMADLRELAQIAQKAQADAMAIINQRAAAHMADFKGFVPPGSKK